jgi:hypothetical protein
MKTTINNLDLKKLADFLVRAKTKTYAFGGKEIKPWRKGFKELEYRENDWYYRDSYAGFFMAPGQEVVYYKNKPVWAMAYSGGMIESLIGDVDFAKKTFNFLKGSLKRVNAKKPFRGPEKLIRKEWTYNCKVKGDISSFAGIEEIKYKGKVVFVQNYLGGLIIAK